MKNNSLFTLLCLTLTSLPLAGQIGGDHHFEFLNVPNASRITALGGYLTTVKDDDINLALTNPAALNEAMGGAISFQHNFYLSDINSGYVAYGHHLNETPYTLHGGFQYLQYGEFQETDDLGNVTGDFKAGELAMIVGVGRQLNEHYSIGVNLKMISSRFETYSAYALGGDLSGMYYNPDNELAVSISLTNFGFVLSDYTEQTTPSMPTQLQIGVSKRLKHLPFRYSIIAHHLEQWDIAYDDPSVQDQTLLFGEENSSDSGPGFVDKVARHFVFSGEFLLGKEENMRLRLAYNNLRRAELNLVNQFTLAGFSFGVGLKVRRFRIDYAFGGYHYASGAHHLGISTNVKSFQTKLSEI